MVQFTRSTFFGVLFAIVALNASRADASLVIDFKFDLSQYAQAGDQMLSGANQAIFSGAGLFWENAITGYADNISRTLTIYAAGFSQPASGGSVLLGSAGPRLLSSFAANSESYVFAIEGSARFNVHPDAIGSGTLDPLTIRHEVGHILGIGTLWDNNGDYVNGSGQYTGANALAAYKAEFDPSATFVPVELDGGQGTANGHWNEGNSPLLTVRSGPNFGENLDNALMTGFLSGSGFLSDTTLGSLQDMGFTTVPFNATAVPEPTSMAFVGLAIVACVSRRQRLRVTSDCLLASSIECS